MSVLLLVCDFAVYILHCCRLLKKKGRKGQVAGFQPISSVEKESKKNVPPGKTSVNAEKTGKLAANKHELETRISLMERSESQITDRSDTLDLELM